LILHVNIYAFLFKYPAWEPKTACVMENFYVASQIT